ncbi:Dynactin subunit p22 [Trinorchestia longiramus]|nr:Dynactin subunit p22 [Trinorchestia longiramus]
MDLLETRLQRLEQKMFGSAPREGSYPEVVSTLADLSTDLGNALSTRDRMMAVMKRLDELDSYLDPCYGTAATQLPVGALSDLLLSQSEYWQQHHQRLQQLTQLRPALDSQPIRDCVSESGALVQLSYKQSELEQLGQEQSQRITSFLESYNTIIQTLSQTFVRMDELVTRAEVAAQAKAVVD